MRALLGCVNKLINPKRLALIVCSLLSIISSLVWSPSALAATRTFTSIGAAGDGRGYVLTADNGQNYAFNVPYRGNPTGFTGRIVGTGTTMDGQGYANISSIGQIYAYGTVQHRGNPTGFSGEIADIAVTGDGRGYVAISTTGQVYAYGTVAYRGNPTGFSGRMVRIAVTADGQGYMAVSSTGQFYAYGTVRAQSNPRGFTGDITDVSITADGQGTVAVSSAGQFYAYGTARAWPNPVNFTGRMIGVSVSANGQGLVALSSSGQTYAYGNIPHRGNGDPGVVDNVIDTKYQQMGGSTSYLGSPTSGYFSARNGGLGRHFQGGSIYWSSATGAHAVHSYMRDRWAGFGWENSFLGYPTIDTFQAKGGGLGQHFQGNGSIYWSTASGAHVVQGAIRGKWASKSWENGFLGYPISDEFVGSHNSRGTHFQGGSIYWSGPTGAHEVHGAIRDKWIAKGWENSYLGLPISDETTAYNGQVLVSHFTGGDIYYNAAYGATETLPPNVADPIHTQGAPVAVAPPGRRSYSLDLSLNPTGYTYIPAKPDLAFNELRRCFNCSFPIPGAPASFPAQGQFMPLNACGFIVNASICAAPVTAYSNGRTYIRYTSQPGHFDGVDGTVTFTFFERGGSLWMNVTGYVINPALSESITRPGASFMWQNFAETLGQKIWVNDCHNGC